MTTVAINGLVQEMQGVKARMTRKESNVEKIKKALAVATCVLSKLVDPVNKLRSSIEKSSKEERKRSKAGEGKKEE